MPAPSTIRPETSATFRNACHITWRTLERLLFATLKYGAPTSSPTCRWRNGWLSRHTTWCVPTSRSTDRCWTGSRRRRRPWSAPEPMARGAGLRAMSTELDAAVHRRLGRFAMVQPAGPDYPINDLIAKRWSPFAFDDRRVSDDDLRALFEAARWSASANNEQPWSYIVATRDQTHSSSSALSSDRFYNRTEAARSYRECSSSSRRCLRSTWAPPTPRCPDGCPSWDWARPWE